MMRPATKKVPKTYERDTNNDKDMDMMISGTSTNTPGVPRYKGIKMSIHDDDGNDLQGNAAKYSKTSARGSESKSGAFEEKILHR
jgi:hypothetical protein